MEYTTPQFTSMIAGILLLIVAAFQFMLAVGFPYGAISYGGYHKGVLPKKLRITSAVAVLVWLCFGLVFIHHATVIDLGLSTGFVKISLWIVTGLCALGTVENAISKSKKERLIWTPIVAASFLLGLYICLHFH